MCEAISVKRSLELRGATVGGRIAWAKTPRLSAAAQSSTAWAASPTISGMICVSPSGGEIPARANAERISALFAWSFSTRRGCSLSNSSAASAPAIAGGGGAVEKISVRAEFTRYSTVALEAHA